ncbi:MAG: alpha/beta hydrolase family protein, partial [Candidatus Latescibacterota bacterium]
MKKYTVSTIIPLFCIVSIAVMGLGISEGLAAPPDIAGKWLGVIKAPGVELRMGFEISKTADGGYTAVVHSIDQGVMNIPVSTVAVIGDSLRLEVKSAFAYEGRLSPDGKAVDGNWVQGDLTPLPMKRVDTLPQLNRPQTPRKPYPYVEEDVAYENPAAEVKIAGTLTMPKGKGLFPAVLLVAGSGPSDRDETILMHNPFLVLADHLTRQGIAVLRVDKRGIGKTTGAFRGSGITDFASDALAGVEYLKSRPEIDSKR